MRMRYKPWARPELEESFFYIDNPQDYKNKWKTVFEKDSPLYLELGCGKGSFIAKLSHNNPNINYIAIDLVDVMLGMAKRNVEVEYGIRTTTDKEEIEDEVEKGKQVKNLKLVRYDISRINDILGPEDKINRIYINFCNPWPRGKHNKRRLTFDRNLLNYKNFLSDDGKIFFKTDNDELFEDSLKYFTKAGYNVEKFTYDLAVEKAFWDGEENLKTEHEKMFEADGIKIKALIASK
jgi:tRNA (guanine-N7-)-methyltransferase